MENAFTKIEKKDTDFKNETFIDFERLTKEKVDIWILALPHDNHLQKHDCLISLNWLRNDYLQNGNKGLLLQNSHPKNGVWLKTMKREFVGWENIKQDNIGLYDKQKQEYFIYFTSIMSYKNFRREDNKIKNLVYMYFEVELQTVRNNQAPVFVQILKDIQFENKFLIWNYPTNDCKWWKIPLMKLLDIQTWKNNCKDSEWVCDYEMNTNDYEYAMKIRMWNPHRHKYKKTWLFNMSHSLVGEKKAIEWETGIIPNRQEN